jgi:hypothetical protein
MAPSLKQLACRQVIASPHHAGVARMGNPSRGEWTLGKGGAKDAVDEHRVGGEAAATEVDADRDARRTAPNSSFDGVPDEPRGPRADRLHRNLQRHGRTPLGAPSERERVGRDSLQRDLCCCEWRRIYAGAAGEEAFLPDVGVHRRRGDGCDLVPLTDDLESLLCEHPISSIAAAARSATAVGMGNSGRPGSGTGAVVNRHGTDPTDDPTRRIALFATTLTVSVRAVADGAGSPTKPYLGNASAE